ncbi:hypothetical protein [Amycolatopsis sp. lyj-23]|uniref:hypothetical protein n=1 Tax=Amycolatopsis sp. lyj-23 TaxID=2789283 RepID=UPI00397E5B9B
MRKHTKTLLTLIAIFTFLTSIFKCALANRTFRATQPSTRKSRQRRTLNPGARSFDSPRKSRSSALELILLATYVIFIAGSIWALIAFYGQYSKISDFPPRAADAGGARLYFSQQGVDAIMQAKVTDSKWSGQQLDIYINATGKDVGHDLGFRVVLTGSLATQPELPLWDKKDAHGCWRNLYVIPEQSYSCVMNKGTSDGLGGNVPNLDQIVVAGDMLPAQQDHTWAQVTIYTDQSMRTSAGKRTNFSLPQFGTKKVPESIRNIPYEVGISEKVFAPSKLDLVIDYRDLDPNEKIDSIAPDLYESGKLSWIETDSSIIHPRGSIVNVELEESGQRQLYLIGILAGLLSAIAPMAFSAACKKIEKLTRKRVK